jgi:hypothetical protein
LTTDKTSLVLKGIVKNTLEDVRMKKMQKLAEE